MIIDRETTLVEFVLLTDSQTYFVEYLLGELILSTSISQAMKFDDENMAFRFKKMLHQSCQLTTSVNTYIDQLFNLNNAGL